MHDSVVRRRQFLRLTAAGSLSLVVAASPRAHAAESVTVLGPPGRAIDPRTIPRFRTPLVVPSRMPRSGRVRSHGVDVDCYDVAARQVRQQMLPHGMPSTPLFAYGPVTGDTSADLRATRFPSMTIEATYGRPSRVRWRNELVDEHGRYRPHLFAVDPTLHWANPPGGAQGRDTKPVFTTTPGPYEGPVPLVTHVHGATHVGDESDGYSESWYLPDAVDLPHGYARHGSWYEFFAAKAAARSGARWEPGSSVHDYPNVDRACTNWYHDHALGITRLNVHAGLAGMYVVRGGPQGDAAVHDALTGRPAVLPGPGPSTARDGTGRGDGDGEDHDRRDADGEDTRPVHEVPLVIADRAFRPDGSLFYPDSRTDFDDAPGPYVPDGDLPPIWNPEFFGNTLTVNGTTWPVWEVSRRRYRLRVVNACGARFLLLDVGQVPGALLHQIGNDGGFLAAPVDVTRRGVLLAPAERADLVLDLSAVPAGDHVIRNLGPDDPYGGGEPGDGFEPADPETTGGVMMLRVRGHRVDDPSTPARRLRLPRPAPLPAARVRRRLAMAEMMSQTWDGPSMASLGTVDGDPSVAPARVVPLMWGDSVTETPRAGVTELWEIYNTTEDAHPVHLHESKFEVVDRQPIVVTEDAADRTHHVMVEPGSVPRPPGPQETGVKDTVVAYPSEVTRIRVRFGSSGQYVWHCHVLEHEDNEMMRPMRIGPVQPGQPTGTDRRAR